MDSHFRDNINLPNSHPSVFGSLLLVLSQKSGFRATWSDCSETSPENQKKFKDCDSRRRDFSRDTTPQNPKLHRLDPFLIFLIFFHILRKIRKNLHWFYLIFRIFWCYFYDFIW